MNEPILSKYTSLHFSRIFLSFFKRNITFNFRLYVMYQQVFIALIMGQHAPLYVVKVSFRFVSKK